MKKLILPLVSITLAATAQAEMPNIKWAGDFRYRHENIDNGTVEDHNTQERIRARLQATADVTNAVSVKARIASGTGSATSTNQTLDGAGSNKGLDIDIFQIDWKIAKSTKLTLGKMSNPMYAVGSSDIVFDRDLTPEGMALNYQKNIFFATLGRFWIQNVTNNSNDVMLYAPQAGIKVSTSSISITAGASWYNFAGSNGNLGNATKGNSSTANDYKVLNGFVDITGNLGDIGYSVFFDYINNSEVENKNTGWLAGSKFSYKNFSLTYDYRWVEADATLDLLAESDAGGSSGGTGLYGHRTSIAYKINQNVSTAATYYTHTLQSSKKHYDKYLFDISFKF